MQILVIRHTEAEEVHDAAVAGRTDAQRALTKEGAKRMKKAAQGLREWVEDLNLIVSSPLLRAVQTADILAEAYPRAAREQHARLAPGFHPQKLLEWCLKQSGPLALVGHEPDLSGWVGYVSSGAQRGLVNMKKGSVCCLDVPEAAHPGEGRILWLLTVKQLAELG
ncbi:MAG TPA: histidine phosphatase family protein [Gammaproteobacteria bacterium]|nr:histidine phosphatase family protein [Gammaproteobacteria bacterium]